MQCTNLRTRQGLQLHVYPDVLLSKKSQPVTVFDEKLTQLVIDLFQNLQMQGGVGLSACQMGVDKSLFVFKTPESEGVMVNPKVIEFSKEMDEAQEGCLSLPGVFLMVKRPLSITLEWQDQDGKTQQGLFTGLAGRCIQHEYDHLQGLTIVDHISKLKRDIIKKKLQKAMKKLEEMKKGQQDVVEEYNRLTAEISNRSAPTGCDPGAESSQVTA